MNADEQASDAARYESRVLRAFVRDGRLVSIPAQDRKRQVVLRWLLDAAFPDDVPYEERDVNMRLALIHRDVAALRRYLIEAGLMTRSSDVYRRVAPIQAPRGLVEANEASSSIRPAVPRGPSPGDRPRPRRRAG
jgi:hypothetical protein